MIDEEIKAVIEGSAFLSLITIDKNGNPYPIVAGKGEVKGDTVVFGIYKMETTQKNLADNKNAWVVAATMDSAPKGYRLSGSAEIRDKQLIFTPFAADALI
jgi:uncharacterized protein